MKRKKLILSFLFLFMAHVYTEDVNQKMAQSLQYMSAGDYDVAEKNFLEILQTPLSKKDKATVLYDLGLIYLRQKKLQKAVDTFESVDFPDAIPKVFKETFFYDKSLALFLLALSLIQTDTEQKQVEIILNQALQRANEAIAQTNTPSSSLLRLREEILLKKGTLQDIYYQKLLKNESFKNFTQSFGAYCKAKNELISKINSSTGTQSTKQAYYNALYTSIRQDIDVFISDLKLRLQNTPFSTKTVILNELEKIGDGFSENAMAYSLLRLEDVLLYVESQIENKDPILSFLYIMQKNYANLKFLSKQIPGYLNENDQFLIQLLENKLTKLKSEPNSRKEILKTQEFLVRFQSERSKNVQSIQSDIAFLKALNTPVSDLFNEVFSTSQFSKEKLSALGALLGIEIQTMKNESSRNDFALAQMRILNLEKFSSLNAESAQSELVFAWSLCCPRECLLELLKKISSKENQNDMQIFIGYVGIANQAYGKVYGSDAPDFVKVLKEMLGNTQDFSRTKNEVILFANTAASYLELLQNQTQENLLLQIQNAYTRQTKILDIFNELESLYFDALKGEKNSSLVSIAQKSFTNMSFISSQEKKTFTALEEALVRLPFDTETLKKIRDYFLELYPLLDFSTSLDFQNMYSAIENNKKNAVRVMDIIKQIEGLLKEKTAKEAKKVPEQKIESPKEELQVEMPSFSISDENALKLLQEMEKEDRKVKMNQNYVPGIRPW